jgi:hypothetical protein
VADAVDRPRPSPALDFSRSLGNMTPEPLVAYRGVVYPWRCDHVGHMNVM